MKVLRWRLVGALSGLLLGAAHACDLQVQAGWIRAAPPGAASLAGYAVLKNTGARELVITGVSTAAADRAMIHESSVTNGIAAMRMLGSLAVPPGGAVTLAPGGKHVMLTGLKANPKAGEHVTLAFTDSTGCVTQADFSVRGLN